MKKPVSEKKEHQRQKILQIAFNEWGKNNFCHTSLSSLASRLGITKPALYRYFPSKLELLNAMDNHFNTDYRNLLLTFINDTSSTNLTQAVTLLTELHYRFFHNHPAYYIFFMRQVMEGSLFSSENTMNLVEELGKNMRTILSREKKQLSTQELTTGLRYIFTTIVFWLAPLFMEKGAQHIFFTDGHIPSAEDVKQSAIHYCLTGLYKDSSDINMSAARFKIEQQLQAVTARIELLPEDRLFSAIETVVSRSGLEEASIDKIATYLGMTKSSLYFYFKNKDDMLGQMMQRKQDFVLQQLHQIIRAYTNFTDKSYAFMVATASTLLERPVMFTIFNWLRIQNIKLNLNPPKKEYLKDLFDFVIDAADAGLLKIQPVEALRAGVFLHVLTFSAVLEFKEQPETNGELFEELRLLHHHYLYGFPGDHQS